MNESSSPRHRKHRVRTKLRRDLHPQSMNATLDRQNKQRLATQATLEFPQFRNVVHRKRSPPPFTVAHHAPPEASSETQQQLHSLVAERRLHNRYLDLADKDGDGEIDTNWKKGSKDKHFNACPVLSPKRRPFSPALFPGHETLHFVQDMHLLQRSRPKLGILTSPLWGGRQINPASFSAPPGLKSQAPLNGNVRGPLKIVPFLCSTRRRNQLKHATAHQKQTRWKSTQLPGGRHGHPSYFQGLQMATMKKGLHNNRATQQWKGPPRHVYETFLSRHHHSLCQTE